MANNKVQLSNGTVVIDLTSDTVTSAAHIKQGLVGHLADGTTATGTLVEKDVKSVTYNFTGGATASVSTSEVVTGQGFSVKLKAPTGYSLNGVTVTMSGVDITSQVFTLDEAGGGGSTPVISVVDTTDSHGGTVRTITALDISDTTAVAGDVAQGKYFYTAQGVKTAGTGSGGTPSATQHSIYFEFSDSTNTTINAWYDDSFISNAITATTPTTYGGKTVTLAQLDGVTWYEVSGDIPLNTELVDYNAIVQGYYVDDAANGAITAGDSWNCVTDYLPIDPSMTFSFACSAWYGIGFYNASKTPIRGVLANDLGTVQNDYVHGTITPSNIPSNAAYCVLTGNPYALTSNYLSFIRTA